MYFYNLVMEVKIDIVAKNQTVFIHGRHISDNIILANEMIHFLMVNQHCFKLYMPVKILVKLF